MVFYSLPEDTTPAGLTLVARADEKYHEQLDEKEASKLQALRAELSPSEVSSLIDAATELQKEQDSVGDTSSLPYITVQDSVSRDAETFHSELDSLKSVPHSSLQRDYQPTDGVAYTDAVFDISQLPSHLTCRTS